MEEALHSLNKYSKKIKRINDKLSSISWECVNARETRDFGAVDKLVEEKNRLKFMHNDTVSVCKQIISDYKIPTKMLQGMSSFKSLD